jgi:predicted Zn-dependent protease
MRYVYLATCTNSECIAYNEDVRIVDATDPTVCGGCHGNITPQKTDEVWEDGVS